MRHVGHDEDFVSDGGSDDQLTNAVRNCRNDDLRCVLDQQADLMRRLVEICEMQNIYNACSIILIFFSLSGCFGESEKAKAPKKDYIIVKNDGVENFKVDVQYRVKQMILVFND